MTQWSYMSTSFINQIEDEEMVKELNRQGRLGWEVVSICFQESHRTVFFKRPKPPGPAQLGET